MVRLQRRVLLFSAVIGGAGWFAHGTLIAAAAEAPGGPNVIVRLAVLGTERVAGQAYALEMRCASPDGKTVPAIANAPGAPTISATPSTTPTGSTSAGVVSFTLAAGALRTVGAAEFPTLTAADACTLRATPSDGAETSFRTSQPARSDGSVPNAAPGVLVGGGYQSAPARADGQMITVTQAFNGDVQMTARITETAGSVGGVGPTPLAVELRCDSGFLQSARLTDAQTQLFTGIPVGARCRATELQGSGARYADNSGDPNDGILTVVATPAACWDLRVTAASCRVSVTVTVGARVNPGDADVTTTTSATTTTTSPSTTVASATTAAPAVTPAPATPVEATPAFTG